MAGSTAGKKVFIVGPGFIGWNVLDLLVAEGYSVTGFVRRKEHAEQIKASGAEAVIGDLHDHDKIAEQVAVNDIVFHTATADDLPSVQAILAGLRQRAQKGQQTVYIHTSGTSVLDDKSLNAYKTETIYHDTDRALIDSVPDSAPHREIDLTIIKAQEELGDKAKIAIMTPPIIYGFVPHHARLTIQLPTLTRFALKHGFAGYVGEGKSVESAIHVLDLARGYITLLHHLESSPPGPANPYFFCENGETEPSWRDVATAIGEGLHNAGKLSDATPRTIPENLYGDLFGAATGPVIALNSRSRADRLRELGWKPREKGWKQSFLEDELPEILKEEHDGSFAGYKGVAAK